MVCADLRPDARADGFERDLAVDTHDLIVERGGLAEFFEADVTSEEAMRARTPEDQAAYTALNAHRMNQAEAGFKAALAKNPNDAQALAGMGYVRMEQANFGGVHIRQ